MQKAIPPYRSAHAMNRHTARRMKFVLYSPHELVHNRGAGFWSNVEGWVEFTAATQFTVQSVPSCNLPPSGGHDAKWIMWEPELPATGVRRTRTQQAFSPVPA